MYDLRKQNSLLDKHLANQSEYLQLYFIEPCYQKKYSWLMTIIIPIFKDSTIAAIAFCFQEDSSCTLSNTQVHKLAYQVTYGSLEPQCPVTSAIDGVHDGLLSAILLALPPISTARSRLKALWSGCCFFKALSMHASVTLTTYSISALLWRAMLLSFASAGSISESSLSKGKSGRLEASKYSPENSRASSPAWRQLLSSTAHK